MGILSNTHKVGSGQQVGNIAVKVGDQQREWSQQVAACAAQHGELGGEELEAHHNVRGGGEVDGEILHKVVGLLQRCRTGRVHGGVGVER